MVVQKKRKQTTMIASIKSLLLATTCIFVFTGGISALHIIKHPISCKRKHEDALAFVLSLHRSGSPRVGRDKVILFNKINGGNNIGPAENYLRMMNGNPVDQQHQQHLEDPTIHSDVNGYSSLNINGSKNEGDSVLLVEDSMIPVSTQSADGLAVHVQEPTSASMGKEQPLNEDILSEDELLESKEIMNATSAILIPTDSSESVDQQAFVSNLIRNFWTSKDSSNDEKDRAEESRRWR